MSSQQQSVIQWNNVKQIDLGEEGELVGNAGSQVNSQAQPYFIIPMDSAMKNSPCKTEYLDIRIEVKQEIDPLGDDSQIETQHTFNSEKQDLKCTACPKVFSTKQHLERHMNLHSLEKLYTCPECDKVLADKSYLIRHMKIHTGERNHECVQCDKRFLSASSLKRHQSTHDPSLRLFICTECDKRFPDNSGLKKHAKTHDRVKTHICTICAKGFSNVGDLNIHFKYHDHVKHFKCEDCGKEFSRNNNLLRHRAIHSGVGDFKCTICSVRFQHAATLTRHILSCHPGEVNVKTKKQSESKSVEKATKDHDDNFAQAIKSEPLDGKPDQTSQCDVAIDQSTNSQVHVSNVVPVQNELCNVSSGYQIDSENMNSSAYEIYQIDDSGSLVKISDSSAPSSQSIQIKILNPLLN